MTWSQIVGNVIVPVGMALVLGIGGIVMARIVASKYEKDR
jgi:hypothetical protein